MWANRILKILLMLVSWLVIPIQLVTTFILGILVSITFGLLLFPLSLIWIVCFFGPLLGLSWLWEKVFFLRIPIALLGIPLAFIANIFASLVPSMGELDSRLDKLIFTESWPCCLDYWRMITTKSLPHNPQSHIFKQIFFESFLKTPLYRQYFQSLGVIDPDEMKAEGKIEDVSDIINFTDEEMYFNNARQYRKEALIIAKKELIRRKLIS